MGLNCRVAPGGKVHAADIVVLSGGRTVYGPRCGADRGRFRGTARPTDAPVTCTARACVDAAVPKVEEPKAEEPRG